MAAVVQQNDLVFEFASNVMEDEQQVRNLEKKWVLMYDCFICIKKVFEDNSWI